VRPSRLELEGFTSFAERVEIDFDGAGYFALVGPTGAGKSSVIDALTFALYGSVPRYADERLVAPVITQGRLEARVRLDFSIGADNYTVARVVRRNPKGGGATTKEARLEQGETVLAAGDDVNERVERLLGLTFDHFTKCVVLPQGAFARFLHDKPKDRQQLLTELLDLGIYDAVMALAHGRAKAADAEAAMIGQQLEAVAELVTPEARADADTRVTTLETLVARIDAEQPNVDAARERERIAREAAQTARQWTTRLRTITAPAGTAHLAARAKQVGETLEDAEAALAKADQALRDALANRKDLPDRGPLDAARAAHIERADLVERLTAARADVAARAADVAAATVALETAEAAVTAAREHLEAARLMDRAADLARTLVAGEPCPVCRQTVGAVPHVDIADLAAADAALAAATVTATAARAQADAAGLAHARADEQLAAGERRLEVLDRDLAGHPDLAAVDEMIRRIAAADADEQRARADELQARTQHTAARGALAALERDDRQARDAYGMVRDDVAALGPPPPAHASVAADWDALVAWATGQIAGQDAVALGHEQVATQAAEERAAIVDRLLAACAEAAVEVPKGTPGRDAVVHELAAARQRVETITRAHTDFAALTARATDATDRAQVAQSLHRHLSARGFENWLLDDAVVALVAHATEVLLDLSEGQYSLVVDDKGGFGVVDHRNADERRLARTLSGGETFLASLALALALADQIGNLAAGGAARLESLFLDEGFGTLDPDTLDTVAATMENLAAGGRMVGVITHVRDLAERVPVRFEVTKGPGGSTVERIDA